MDSSQDRLGVAHTASRVTFVALECQSTHVRHRKTHSDNVVKYYHVLLNETFSTHYLRANSRVTRACLKNKRYSDRGTIVLEAHGSDFTTD